MTGALSILARHRGFGRPIRLNGSKWIMKKNGDFAEVIYFVGVPDGI
jgi:hypothetical protein